MTGTLLTQEQITAGLSFGDYYLGASQFTYSVPGAGAVWPGYDPGSEPFSDYSVLSAAQANAFRAAIAQWDDLIAPDFSEVPDTASGRGEVRAAFTAEGGGTAAYAYSGTPQPPGSAVGDVWINSDSTSDDLSRGNYGFELLLHELGHTLGLKHPFEGTPLPADYENRRYTVMSYTEATDSLVVTFTANGNSIRADSGFVVAITPMVADIAAVQAIYGAETNTRIGDTVYHFTQGEAVFQSLYDAGGTDTIDVSDFTRPNMIDLTPGAYSSIGEFSRDDQVAYWSAQFPGFGSFIGDVLGQPDLFTFTDNVGISLSTTIENVEGGSGADLILGNVVANVIRGNDGDDTISGGAGDDRLEGGAGADTLQGDGGSDILIGGAGIDVAVFAGALASYTLSLDGSDLLVAAGAQDVDRINGVENFQFAGVSYTLAQLLATAQPGATQLERIDPADDATAVPVVANVNLTFDAAVARGAGTIVLAKADGTVVESFDAATSTRLTLVGNQLVIDPTRPLDPGTAYMLTTPAGALSVGGESFTGLDGYTFTTLAAATVPPQFLLAAPAGVEATVQGYGAVVGDAGVQDITVANLPGRIEFDGSFNAGGDRIHLSGDAADYSIKRSGSSVTISDGDTVIAVPIGNGGADIVFGDGSRTLSYVPSEAAFHIGAQAVTTTAQGITAAAQAPTSTGATDPDALAQLVMTASGTATAGGTVFVYGTTNGHETTGVLAGSHVSFDGSFNQGGDTILLAGNAASYSAVRSGSAVVLTSGDESVTIPVGLSAATISFTDGDRALVFDAASGVVKLGGATIGSSAAPLTATVHTAASVDQDNDGNLATQFTLNAATGNFEYSDDADTAQNVLLDHFARGDHVTVHEDAATFAFSASGGDITLSHNEADGTTSTLVIGDVADPTAYVSDYASATAAAGFEFVTFAL